MMDWVQIGSALLLVAMIAFLFPRAKQALEASAQAEERDWMGLVIPLAAVVGFVALMLALV